MPNVQAVSGSYGIETFESLTLGVSPYATTSGDGPFYTYTTITGSGGNEPSYVTNTGNDSNRSLLMDRSSSSDSSIVSPVFVRDDGGVFCTEVSGYTAQFDFLVPNLPPVNTALFFGYIESVGLDVVATNNDQVAGMILYPGGQVDTHINNGDGVGGTGTDADALFGITITANTWHTAGFKFNCTTRTLTVIVDGFTGVSDLVNTEGWPNVNRVVMGIPFGAGDLPYVVPDVYVDNMEFANENLEQPGVPDYKFCANRDDENGMFGYTYNEGVNFETNPPAGLRISMDDYYQFVGYDDNSEYLAKGFDTGTTGIAVRAKIEAAEEGFESIFIVAFTTGAGGLPSVTTKPTNVNGNNGADGNNFDNSIQVRFRESGNDWAVKIIANVGGTLQTIGSTAFFGTPNNAFLYNVSVDSQSTLVTVKDDTGNILMDRNLPAGLQDVVWKDQWFIGTGNAALAQFSSTTALDNFDDNQRSTCIYDLTGTLVVNGSPGADPDSLPGDDGDNEGGDGGNTTPGGGIGALPDWVLPTILTYVTGLLLGAILCIFVSRGEIAIIMGFMFLATIFSIYAWGMPWFIPVILLILPSLAVVIWKGPWSS